MNVPMTADIYVLLPQIIGALFVGNALYFFGQNDKLEKNNLVFASLGFLALVFQGIFIFCYPVLEANAVVPALSEKLRCVINTGFVAFSSLCLIVGGFEYAHVLSWIKKTVTVPVFLLFWIATIWIANHDTVEGQVVLQALYLTIGLFFLGTFFCMSRFTSNAYNLRSAGFVTLILALYYFQDVTNVHYKSWVAEGFIYVFLVWTIYRTTMRQLRRETRDLADELRATKAKIPMIIQASPFPVVVSALKDNRVLLANEKACALFSVDMENIQQFRTDEYYTDVNLHNELLQELSTSPVVENFQALLRKPNSEETFWVEISARVIDYDNEVALYSVYKDITAQKKHEHDLFAKAVLDPLTGCYNRRQFQELAMRELKTAWRYNTQFCLIMMDIDHFKNVNDTYGHAFGDEVLKTLAKVCKSTVRDSDIFARYGGEEFICLLTQTNTGGGVCLAERLRKNIEQTVLKQPSGEPFQFTISMGIVGSDNVDNLDDLIKRADSALYIAKESGRNQVRLYGDTENADSFKMYLSAEQNKT